MSQARARGLALLVGKISRRPCFPAWDTVLLLWLLVRWAEVML